MINILLAPFILLSAIGLVLSLIVHVIALSGGQVPFGNYVWSLHLGVFVVFIPAILSSQRLTKDFKSKDYWKAALRACPTWMKGMTLFFFGYAFINIIIFAIMTSNSKPSGTTEFRAASGHWMAFYSVALAMLYSTTHVTQIDQQRRCRNGHIVTPLAKFCEECGAQVIDR